MHFTIKVIKQNKKIPSLICSQSNSIFFFADLLLYQHSIQNKQNIMSKDINICKLLLLHTQFCISLKCFVTRESMRLERIYFKKKQY